MLKIIRKNFVRWLDFQKDNSKFILIPHTQLRAKKSSGETLIH